MSRWELWAVAGIAIWCAVALILGPIIGHWMRVSRESAEAISRRRPS